jgi:hypothetical protein
MLITLRLRRRRRPMPSAIAEIISRGWEAAIKGTSRALAA